MKKIYSSEHQEAWQISAPRTIFTNPVMQMAASTVRCARTGKVQDFYKLLFPGWVNVVAVTATKEILIIRQYRFGTDRMEIEIPGGAVNEGENPLSAGIRELLEETGYVGENGRIIGKVCPNPAIQNNFCYTVLVEDAHKVSEPRQDDMEDIQVCTLPHKEIETLVADGTINHGLVLNGLMFFALEQAKNAQPQTTPAFWP